MGQRRKGRSRQDMAAGSPEEIEEERRLLYVAMNRAKDALHLIHPHRFYANGQRRLGDRFVRAPRSRFIPAALLSMFDGADDRPEAGPYGQQRRLPNVDVRARLRAMSQ